MITTLTVGFVAGLSLIVAIGAQNAFVLRQGVRREHLGVVIVVCVVSDIALIAAGTAGVGGALVRAPVLASVARWAGAAFLILLAFQAARRALRPSSLTTDGAPDGITLKQAMLTAIALTWLNPHVYIDTVLLLGSLAASQPPIDGAPQIPVAWIFAAGAALASAAWFTGLGYGARLLSPLFARPVAWRILDAIICVVMIVIAVLLVAGA